MAKPRTSPNRLRETPPANQSLPRERRPLRLRWSAWTRQHQQSFRASLRRLLGRPWSTALTGLVMGIALALPLLLFVVLDNARGLAGGLREAREFTIFPSTARRIRNRSPVRRPTGQACLMSLACSAHAGTGLGRFPQLSGFSEASMS